MIKTVDNFNVIIGETNDWVRVRENTTPYRYVDVPFNTWDEIVRYVMLARAGYEELKMEDKSHG